MRRLLLLICILGIGTLCFAQAPSLGSASTFGVLGSSTVTNTGASVITGDLGVNPPGVSATGFLLSNHIVTGPGGGVTAGLGSVTGTIFVADSVALLAHADAIKAYAALVALPCSAANDLSTRGDLGSAVAVL